MEIFAVCNQKGGSGKTTTAISLSASLALNKCKVLLVDLDPQAHATMGLNIDAKKTIYDVLSNISRDKCLLNDAIVKVQTNFDIVPSSIVLSTIEQELSEEIGRELKLYNEIKKLKVNYDYVIIDCPPNLGLLTVNALRAANSAIIPVEASRFAVDGVSRLIDIINLIADRLNHHVEYSVLVTIFDSRLRHSFRILDRIKKDFAGKIFSTIIHTNVKLKESQAAGVTVFEFDKYCRGSKDYFTLSREMISQKEKEARAKTEAKTETKKEVEATQPIEKRISEKLRNIRKEKIKEFFEITFSFQAPTARSVFVVGDFNNWSMDKNSMMKKEDNNGVWTKKLPFKEGLYQYRFVVDGEWVEDPTNPRASRNPYGELNSILEIK